jgi:hypothetical protein
VVVTSPNPPVYPPSSIEVIVNDTASAKESAVKNVPAFTHLIMNTLTIEQNRSRITSQIGTSSKIDMKINHLKFL